MKVRDNPLPNFLVLRRLLGSSMVGSRGVFAKRLLRPGAAGRSGDQPWAGGFADGVAVYWKASGVSGTQSCRRLWAAGGGLAWGEVGLA